MSQTNQPAGLKFWTTRDWTAIRLERDGLSWCGTLTAPDTISWAYGAPDDDGLAVMVLADAGEHTPPAGWEYQGTETAQEMDRQVVARCSVCHVVQASEEWLSEQGECPHCFISRRAA